MLNEVKQPMVDSSTSKVGRGGSDTWPERVEISIWMVPEDDHWVALAAEFNVAGMGRTEQNAIDNLSDNLKAYLASFREEGASFTDARRPIPRREEMRLQGRRILGTAEAWRQRKVHQFKHDLMPRTDGLALC